jgi:hypothetical protein
MMINEAKIELGKFSQFRNTPYIDSKFTPKLGVPQFS